MHDDRIEGRWQQIHDKLRTRWSKLTEDDLAVASGNTDYLAGKLRERYGVANTEANLQIAEFNLDVLEDEGLSE